MPLHATQRLVALSNAATPTPYATLSRHSEHGLPPPPRHEQYAAAITTIRRHAAAHNATPHATARCHAASVFTPRALAIRRHHVEWSMSLMSLPLFCCFICRATVVAASIRGRRCRHTRRPRCRRRYAASASLLSPARPYESRHYAKQRRHEYTPLSRHAIQQDTNGQHALPTASPQYTIHGYCHGFVYYVIAFIRRYATRRHYSCHHAFVATALCIWHIRRRCCHRHGDAMPYAYTLRRAKRIYVHTPPRRQ